MKTMADNHDLYFKTEVVLLADVFEGSEVFVLRITSSTPVWYFTAPGLASDALFKGS